MTPFTLALDASTYTGTFAVTGADGQIVAGETAMRGADVERLMPAVADTLARARIAPLQLQRIVCGGGPGSFTSLRIAAAIAKGLAVAGRLELWTMPSLALLVGAEHRAPGRYLAVLDAMRGEWYAQCFSVDDVGVVRADGTRERLATEALGSAAAELAATLLGAPAGVRAAPHARGLTRLDASLVQPVDLSRWEPDYGRLAEAQVKWESAHGRPLVGGGG